MVCWEEWEMTEHTRKPIRGVLLMVLALLAAVAVLSGCREEKAADPVTPTPLGDHSATVLDQDRTTADAQAVVDPAAGEAESDMAEDKDLPDLEEPEVLACTITVESGESIQEAIAAAPAGVVICLTEGTWQENLVIGKSLTLRGAGVERTTIEGTVSGESVLSIGSRTEIVVTVEGLAATGAHGSWAYGVRLEGRARCTIREVSVRGNASNGIYVMDAARVLIVGSSVTGNRGMGIRVQQDAQAEARDTLIEGNSGDGLSLTNSARVTLADTVVRGNGGDGVAVYDTIHVAIERSTIEANAGDGLSVRESFGSTIETHITITDTTFSRNRGYGAALYGSAQVVVTDCAVVDHGRDGVLLAQSVEAVIAGTRISGNAATGLMVTGSARASVENVRITGNASRGVIIQGSAQASIDNTSISDNVWQGVFMGGAVEVSITGSTINGNTFDGLFLRDSAQLTLERSEIAGNALRGVALFQAPCFDNAEVAFTGYIAGLGNTIPGPGEQNGNEEGVVCPDELAFLVTEEGGELDWREEE